MTVPSGNTSVMSFRRVQKLPLTTCARRNYSSHFTTFEANDFCILRDRRKGQKYFIGPLQPEGKLFISKGVVAHKDIISRPPRSVIETHNGSSIDYVALLNPVLIDNHGVPGTPLLGGTSLTVHFPTLDDFVLNVKRACTPIYPKDASTIIRFLDLERGDCVLEAGTGNGSLTLYLARAVAGQGSAGDPGRVDTFDIRENHRRQAERNVCNFARGTYTATVRFHDGSLSTLVADETASECSYDGAVLDMPAPHHELEAVAKYLKNDRFLVCYLPNITQVVDLLRYIKINQLPFAMEDCVDVIIQEWEVRSTTIRSQPDPTLADNIDQTWVCRPKNFDVKGHTAYLVKLRKCVNIECHPTSPIVYP